MSRDDEDHYEIWMRIGRRLDQIKMAEHVTDTEWQHQKALEDLFELLAPRSVLEQRKINADAEASSQT
jgi:hypothetical protein